LFATYSNYERDAQL